jgi:hypothetical protein
MRQIAFRRIVTRIDHGQSGYKFVNLRYRVVPGNAAVIVPKDVCDGVLAYVRPLAVASRRSAASRERAGRPGTDLPCRRRDASSAMRLCSSSGSSLGAAVAGDDLRDRIRVRAVPEAIQHVD